MREFIGRARPRGRGDCATRFRAFKLDDMDSAIVRTFALAVLALACPQAMAQDARERGFITRGMHESEVLQRVGKPDHETFIRNMKGQPEEKAWSYFPDPRDPQTLTILTLRAGVVEEIERKVVR